MQVICGWLKANNKLDVKKLWNGRAILLNPVLVDHRGMKKKSAAYVAGQEYERTGTVTCYKFTPRKLAPKQLAQELKDFREGRESVRGGPVPAQEKYEVIQ